MRAVPTALLDTNVALDCFAFDGPQARPLKEAVLKGRIHLLTCDACVEELARVLRYPRLKLDEQERTAALERYRHVAEVVALRLAEAVPRCRDRDDQVFLDLAAGWQVDYLFSRDARVLATRGRMLQRFGVKVVEPRHWAASQMTAAATNSGAL